MNDFERVMKEQRDSQSAIRTGWVIVGAMAALGGEKMLMLAAGMGRTPFPWWVIAIGAAVGVALAVAGERGR